MDHRNSSPTETSLRKVRDDDLAVFFVQQRDPSAIAMAAFTTQDPDDLEAFTAHWENIRGDDSITIRTVVAGERVAGHVLLHHCYGKPELSYWLGREYWGHGIGTAAVARFVAECCPQRPLFAHAAADNAASLRILQKCGFAEVERRMAFANGRGGEIVEVILCLERA